MITILVELPEDLAKRVQAVQDHLPELIELGLRQWRKQPILTPRQRVEQLWEAEGLVEPIVPSAALRQKACCKRQAPIPAGGQLASELIIQQRGAL